MNLAKTFIEERFTETWDDVRGAEVGHVFYDEFDEGVRLIILRGPNSLCAYLGVAAAHPLAGYDYDDLPISAHGGLTYAGTGVHGDGETYWYGWDYAHSGDRATYDYITPGRAAMAESEHAWTPGEVYADAWTAMYEFKALVRLAEKIARQGWQKKAE